MLRVIKFTVPLVVLALVTVACGNTSSPAESVGTPSADCHFDHTDQGVTATQQAGQDPVLTIDKGAKVPTELQAIDLCPGDGVAAASADTVTVNYVGVGYQTRKVFDSSYDSGSPATFPLSGVIPGWTQGVAGMKPGGVRLLLIPANMAYGSQGRPPVIQPNEALAFIVELDSVGSVTSTSP
jgi:peptidylprolyl isomerase